MSNDFTPPDDDSTAPTEGETKTSIGKTVDLKLKSSSAPDDRRMGIELPSEVNDKYELSHIGRVHLDEGDAVLPAGVDIMIDRVGMEDGRKVAELRITEDGNPFSAGNPTAEDFDAAEEYVEDFQQWLDGVDLDEVDY